MQIGRLTKQDIRTVWGREDADFTPWLAQPENLELLAETLGLGSLERISEEVSVGSFRADIVCHDIEDRKVVIENQFSSTDHKHLGQLLTYLAGTQAKTVIWIAETVREEHRAVIDWLNETTPLDYAFFAVELEVWRIGDSAPAPRFEAVVRPNTWARREMHKVRTAELQDPHRRTEYWSAFLQEMPDIKGLSAPKRAPNMGWMKLAFTGNAALSGCGIYLFRQLNQRQVGVYVSIGRVPSDATADWLPTLAHYQNASPETHEQGTRDVQQFVVRLEADALDESDWSRQHHWMIAQVQKFYEDWCVGLRSDVARLLEQTGD